ncbi:MAG: hypothetical protein H8D55_03015 [Deltaproteobacteria bacterium]|nr:hypothetical protein [Deltaproteobacteria bacterium]
MTWIGFQSQGYLQSMKHVGHAIDRDGKKARIKDTQLQVNKSAISRTRFR